MNQSTKHLQYLQQYFEAIGSWQMAEYFKTLIKEMHCAENK